MRIAGHSRKILITVKISDLEQPISGRLPINNMHEDPSAKSYLKNRSVTFTDQNSQDKSQFSQKRMPEKVEIITRMRPSDFSLRFLT